MKKFVSLLCMITCVFGLTACGSTEEYTAYEQAKIDTAKQIAVEMVVPSFDDFQEESLLEMYEEYTPEEVAFAVEEVWGIEADGFAFMTAVESFNSTYETIGEVVSLGEATAEIDDDTIIVHVPVQGTLANANAEVILSNDRFLRFESAALNPEASMSDLMLKAALNTLIGMGTVFVVLLLISAIISSFKLISKVQGTSDKKDEKKETKTTGVDNAVAQIVVQEETVAATDDMELVAVIAAAIAASEGATSTDGFIVRSIRKVRR